MSRSVINGGESMGSQHGATTTTLRPTEFLSAGNGQASKTALIVLNSPIAEFEYFHRLYHHASLRVAADGGANRLHDLLVERSPQVEWQDALGLALPDIIHGDLDSLDGNVRKRYDSLNVEISKDPDQYSTDFGKCIKTIVARMPHVVNILVMGSLGGRVDQGIGLLHELFREQKVEHPDLQFWLFTEASVSVVLRPGTSRIYTPLSEGLIGRNVGILPLYGPASITIKGFEWDVTDWPTEMGGQVSTSNHIFSDWLTITTDVAVVFTVERANQR